MLQNFFRKVLKNGLTVILEKRKLPVVSVAFAVRAGGVNEESCEKGISHFIEHLLYKGTLIRDAKQIAEEIEKNGGELNGFTDEVITAYWCKMPSRHLNVALEVLSDMIKNPKLDTKEIEKERKVIFEEIKMRKDNPVTYTFDNFKKCLYDTPLGISLIGNEHTINSMDRQKILQKFKQIYQPKNLILCVVGDAEFEKIVSFAEKNFGEGEGKIPNLEINLRNDSKTEKRKGIDQANLIFCYHTPLAGDKKNYVAKVLTTLMAEGMSSKLFLEIREKRNLAYAIKGESEINKLFSHNLIYVGTPKENISEVKNIILKEFEKVADTLNVQELKQVKNQLIGNYQISIENSQNQMINLLMHEINGNAKDFYDFEKNIFEVKIEDIKALARKAVKQHSFFVLEPE